MTKKDYKIINSKYDINVDYDRNMRTNHCSQNLHACWSEIQSFKYSIIFFGVIETYDQDGNILLVEEGYFVNGKHSALSR